MPVQQIKDQVINHLTISIEDAALVSVSHIMSLHELQIMSANKTQLNFWLLAAIGNNENVLQLHGGEVPVRKRILLLLEHNAGVSAKKTSSHSVLNMNNLHCKLSLVCV